ncbi:hypothetical protein BUPH_06776 [Paraburkholderia phenoliruptrix BR3459a]|uniref:Uncharacterized protein n=1 Tax=Paraburkholderia phenoliruptrix BR3459a TaxID=1229205 RepID=K0DYZ2_9BURK|nr:hypothetical protein BUPH_06776 [Paraburkholderia phenoliruptrix BR3459a]
MRCASRGAKRAGRIGVRAFARPDACHTCFTCERYGPADALNVHRFANAHVAVDEAQLACGDALGASGCSLG